MSDPVTNVEIEDVLSSIRKLVAEETRTTPAASRLVDSGRLVLTPSQRVSDSVDRQPAPSEPSKPTLLVDSTLSQKPVAHEFDNTSIEEIPGDAKLSDFGDVEGIFPDAEEFKASLAEDHEPEIEAPPAEEDTNSRLELGRLIEEEVAAAFSTTDADTVDDLTQDDVFTEESAESEVEIDWETVEPEHEAGEIVVDDEQDVGEQSTLEKETLHVSSNNTPLKLDETQLDVETVAAPQTLEDKVAALGRLVARDTGEFEEERDTPVEIKLDTTSGKMAWPEENEIQTDAEASVAHEDPVNMNNVLQSDNAWPQTIPQNVIPDEVPVAKEDSSEVAIPEASVDDMPTARIDEDVLREMVGDIVRQELQGALGERITRNVRKLVRREIHRMLISQELD